MSKIFRRPMFRKGGPINEGIMTGIVDRSMHADNPFVGGDLGEKIKNKMDVIEAAVGKTGLDDPLTQFLLSYGPAVATARPTGSMIATLIGAAKEPTAQLLKDLGEQRKLKTGVALEVLGDLSDEDFAALKKKAQSYAAEGYMGGDANKVLQALIDKELYKDQPKPSEIQREMKEIDMASLMAKKDLGGNSLISTYGAEEVVDQINKVKRGEVEGVNFDEIDIDQPYLRRDTEIESTNEDGSITLVEGEGEDYINGSLIYDYRTNKWFRVQGDMLTPIGG